MIDIEELPLLDQVFLKLVEGQEDCPPEFLKVMDDNFEDLLA